MSLAILVLYSLQGLFAKVRVHASEMLSEVVHHRDLLILAIFCGRKILQGLCCVTLVSRLRPKGHNNDQNQGKAQCLGKNEFP